VKLLLEMLSPDSKNLSKEQYKRLVSAYKHSIYQLKGLVSKIDPWEKNVLEAPYYNFLENLQLQITRFKPVDQIEEFNRLLAQPLLMMPFITEELKAKIPAVLQMPHPDDDS
jgi:hypothetical protein